MTFQAYLDTIKTKTGKTPDDFRGLAAKKGLTEYREVMAWLKSDFALGHGHANVIAHLLTKPEAFTVKPDERIAKLFAGGKAAWRKTYDQIVATTAKFGDDVSVSPTDSYISLLRGKDKFGIVMPSSAERLDIGIKFKGVAPAGRLEAAGTWHNMVTHRVRIGDPKQADKQLFAWLKQAYDAAGGKEKQMDTNDKIIPHASMPAGLSQPALRALTGAGIERLEQLRKVTEEEIKHLHGIGPNALIKLRDALRAKGWTFASEPKTAESGGGKKSIKPKRGATPL